MIGEPNPSLVTQLSAVGRVSDELRLASAQMRRVYSDCAGNSVRFVILDCSGTVMDRYVDAPAVVFVAVFEAFGVPITMDEARVPMGLRKDLHIKALTETPAIAARWETVHGRTPQPADVDALFERFVPMQLELLRAGEYHTLLPGVADVVTELQSRGVGIGITTGFTREMLDLLLAGAKAQGFVPDVSVAGDEVETPRPHPFMVVKNLERMGVLNLRNAMRLTVKVDDTVSGAGEGAPLCWRVAVSKFSNYVVDCAATADALEPAALRRLELAAKEKLIRESGAHYVIDELRDLPAVLAEIDQRLAAGENP
ncbi:MAG: phosphonoacetaldehyde hydrolase [Myxococcales bacterium]|nr:phosphonoacetaldehyde hydrolase [Myxococcales bacterium]